MQEDTRGSAQRFKLVCKVDDLETDGWAERRDLSFGERLRRSMHIFGVFFALAFITVFVPLLHFILPPLMLAVGGFLAFNEFSSTGEVLDGEFICPNCKKIMRLKRDGEEWPRIQRCEGCSFTLALHRS